MLGIGSFRSGFSRLHSGFIIGFPTIYPSSLKVVMVVCKIINRESGQKVILLCGCAQPSHSRTLSHYLYTQRFRVIFKNYFIDISLETGNTISDPKLFFWIFRL